MLLLASSSQRRRELISLGGWSFNVRASNVPEIPAPGETPAAFVQRLSLDKARAVAAQGVEAGTFVIGADTIVVAEDQIIGKPTDAQDAIRILKQLRGGMHEVFTGLTILDTANDQAYTELVRSVVPMRAYADAEIETYVASGNPLDKAGAYAIQHAEFHPVAHESFGDCFANVMGMPLCHLLRRLRQLGVDAPRDLPGACQDFLPYTCPISEKILRS